MVGTILNDNSTPKHLWAKVVNPACYFQNNIYIRLILKRTPYELWKGKTEKCNKLLKIWL